MTDTHIHTKVFSGDATLEYKELLDHCRAHPDRIVCTTEHYDYDYPYINDKLIFDPKQYSQTYNDRKSDYERTYGVAYPVLFGTELGFIDHLNEVYNNLVSIYPFDFVIASIHSVDGVDPYYDKAFYRKGKEKAYSDYLNHIIDMLICFDSFDSLGHYDYVCRYAPFEDPSMIYSDFPDLFDEIFKLLIRKDKALEFNSATASVFKRRGLANYMPDPEIFHKYREAGGNLITFGSDAHSVGNLFSLYDESIDLLRRSGFDHINFYKKRSPVILDI